MRRCFLALIVACDGGSVEPTRPPNVTSVDTLPPGQLAYIRGSGLTHLRSLLLDGVTATELVARSASVAEFRVPSMRARLTSNTHRRLCLRGHLQELGL